MSTEPTQPTTPPLPHADDALLAERHDLRFVDSVCGPYGTWLVSRDFRIAVHRIVSVDFDRLTFSAELWVMGVRDPFSVRLVDVDSFQAFIRALDRRFGLPPS